MRLNKTGRILVSVGVIGWIIIGLLFFNSAKIDAETTPNQTNIYKKIELFVEVFNKLRVNYVDDVDIDELIESSIKGMLEDMDPHTVYFTADDFERFTTDTKGEFGGLGISIDKKGDYITVVSPIEGTPAYRMGIHSGDKIVKIDGEDIVGMSLDEGIKRMRGDKGTKVVIGILRPGVDEELEFEIIRDIIKIKSVPYAFKMDNGIGYIRIRHFNAHVTEELREKLDELESEGIRGLLIDLRFNPGGLLTEAVNTVNEFIGKNKRVVFTKGRNPQANSELFTRYNRIRTGYPVVVLINEASASASEIFAGSLQDWDRGLVVGKTSFGKGSVQRLFPLSGGNGIKITTAKYYINSGRCIHKDINDELLKDERVKNGDLSQEEIKEIQEKAEEENKKEIYYTQSGRVVYGGGGITPDIEIEQSLISDLGIEFRRKNTFFNYSVDYMLENEDSLTEDFEADETIIDDFLEYAKNEGIEMEQAEVDSSFSWIKNSIESNIIAKKFDDVESYKIAIREDTQLQEALALFDKFVTTEEMFVYLEGVEEK